VLTKERFLLEASSNEDGFFYLSKIHLLIEGENFPKVGRCDNLSITSKSLAADTAYEGQSVVLGKSSDYSEYSVQISDVKEFYNIMAYYPHFMITYLNATRTFKGQHVFFDIQDSSTPASMWIARSIYQLFKNMREWSFMLEEPFNSDHPMAEYSKIVFDSLEIPENILEEIDSMPDMHLAKFLKGEENYKIIPDHPAISQDFKDWVWEMVNKYPYKSFEEQIS